MIKPDLINTAKETGLVEFAERWTVEEVSGEINSGGINNYSENLLIGTY